MAGATATGARQGWVGPCLQRKLHVSLDSCAHGTAPDPVACMKGLTARQEWPQGYRCVLSTLIHSANICVVPNLFRALFQALGRAESKI